MHMMLVSKEALLYSLPGLSMGTTLKTKLSRSTCASGWSLRRKSSAPFIIQLPTVSPGCTRAVSTTPRLIDPLLM